MLTRSAVAIIVALASVGAARAQHRHGAGTPVGQHEPGASPYAGAEKRAIKALSDEQLADLRAGRGMGLALAAELNGYPGPAHVIELADRIGLTPEQRSRMDTLHGSMTSETIELGNRVIEHEAELDRLFASRTVTPASLSETLRRIGAAQAALREAHLRYHLATTEVLSPEQVKLYDELRGYKRP